MSRCARRANCRRLKQVHAWRSSALASARPSLAASVESERAPLSSFAKWELAKAMRASTLQTRVCTARRRCVKLDDDAGRLAVSWCDKSLILFKQIC